MRREAVFVGSVLHDLGEHSGSSQNLLVIDACRENPEPGRGRSSIDGSTMRELPSKLSILFGSSAGRKSFESEELGHGLLTYTLLQGLRGKAARDGEISWGLLTSYAQKQVQLEARKIGQEQKPNIILNLNDDPVLAVTADSTTTEPPRTVPGKTEETKDFVNSIGAKMVYIKPGTFEMGSPENEHQRRNDEKQHKVTLTQGFHLGATLVTQKQWKAVLGNNPSSFVGDDLPVETVSWEDAKEFCKKLSATEGRTYRLPYEAEWEYACRAGTKTPFWTGETITTDQANFDGNFPYRESDGKGQYRAKTTPVMTFKANPWGLYDMPGNVWQWCEDWYGAEYYVNSDKKDPQGPSTGSYRGLRGGGWLIIARGCRSANRSGSAPTDRTNILGFRLAVSSPATK